MRHSGPDSWPLPRPQRHSLIARFINSRGPALQAVQSSRTRGADPDEFMNQETEKCASEGKFLLTEKHPECARAVLNQQGLLVGRGWGLACVSTRSTSNCAGAAVPDDDCCCCADAEAASPRSALSQTSRRAASCKPRRCARPARRPRPAQA